MKKTRVPFSFKSWCQRELTRLLKFQVGDEIIDYLLSIETETDVRDYLRDLLATADKTKASATFEQDFFKYWCPPERLPSQLSPKEDELMQELVRADADEMVLFTEKGESRQKGVTPPPGFTKPKPFQSTDRNDLSSSHKGKHGDSYSVSPRSGQTSLTSHHATGLTGSSGKHKQKFVPLMSAEGQSRITTHLPGRHTCQCLAQKHSLVNNCTECGRIVCSQEGSGPCMFCGALVCTPEEEELLARDSKKGQKFREKFLRQFQGKDANRALDHIQKIEERSDGLNKAVTLKDKLLEFDQTSVSRTKVIDDAMDFFAVDSNRWLSAEEREALRSKEKALRELKENSRKNKTISLDFAGRRIVEDNTKIDQYSEEQARSALDKITSSGWSNSSSNGARDSIATHAGTLYNPSIPVDPPKYLESHKEKRAMARRARNKMEDNQKSGPEEKTTTITRLQDGTLQEMRDEGMCLSMHQPWASLLVEGIKRCEGRSWYTTHRGRLWIAAAAKQPETDEIKRIEQFYRTLYRERVCFPSEYPTSCLLGCVDMRDCLTQEEYKEQFPDGESESPYVFVVDNPHYLTVKFPIKGKHKIWKLDSHVHTAAKRGIKPSL